MFLFVYFFNRLCFLFVSICKEVQSTFVDSLSTGSICKDVYSTLVIVYLLYC